MIDPTVNITREQSKQVAQIICREIKESFSKNKNVYEKARKGENQYNQITKWMELNKICDVPWKGAADYFVAMTEWIVDAIWSRLMSILFSQEPYMKAKGADSQSVGKQDNATEFVDMIFRDKIKLYENTNYFFKQILKLPFAVLKYDYWQEYDNQITKEPAQTFINPQTQEPEYLLQDDPEAMVKSMQFIANGYQPAQPQEVLVLNDVEIYNAPRIQYINFNDYAWAPDTKRKAKPYWEADRCFYTINEMVMNVRQEKFIAENVEQVRNQLLGTQTGLDAVIKQREEPIECFNWYGRLPFNEQGELELHDKEAIEQEVYVLVAYKQEELLQILRWPYNRYPKTDRVYIRECYEETNSFEGRSMVQKLYKTQQELNDLHNTIYNNAWIAMQKIFVKKASLQGEQYERPKVYPGAMWEEDIPGEIRMLEVGEVKAIGLELEQTLLNFAERISNISNWNLGTKETQSGKSTATEFMGVIQEGNIGREPLLQRCYKVMAKLCEWTLDYYQDRLPPGMERSIKGEQGDTLYPTAENMMQYRQRGINPEWSQEDWIGNYQWIWQGTTLNSDKQWNLMVDNDLMDRYMPQPMVAGNMLAVWTILKKGLIDRGIKNWNEILPPKEAIIQEMQRMEMQAQAKQNAGQMANTVISKLGERGVPPEQAVQLVRQRMGVNAGNV